MRYYILMSVVEYFHDFFFDFFKFLFSNKFKSFTIECLVIESFFINYFRRKNGI